MAGNDFTGRAEFYCKFLMRNVAPAFLIEIEQHPGEAGIDRLEHEIFNPDDDVLQAFGEFLEDMIPECRVFLQGGLKRRFRDANGHDVTFCDGLGRVAVATE